MLALATDPHGLAVETGSCWSDITVRIQFPDPPKMPDFEFRSGPKFAAILLAAPATAGAAPAHGDEVDT